MSFLKIISPMLNKFSAIIEGKQDYGTGETLLTSEIHIIDVIGQFENNVTITEIANFEGITKQTISEFVNKLVQKGYLRKEKDRKDKRRIKPHLTQKGLVAYQEHKQFHELVEEMLNDLSEFTEPDQSIIIDYIQKLDRKLENIIKLRFKGENFSRSGHQFGKDFPPSIEEKPPKF